MGMESSSAGATTYSVFFDSPQVDDRGRFVTVYDAERFGFRVIAEENIVFHLFAPQLMC